MANEVEHLQVDTDVHDTQVIPGDKLLMDAFNEAKSGEADLPIDEQLQMTATQLGLEGMGRPVPLTETPQDTNNQSSIDLWTRTKLESDENQMVFVQDDDFLRRAGGTRQSKVIDQMRRCPITSGVLATKRLVKETHG